MKNRTDWTLIITLNLKPVLSSRLSYNCLVALVICFLILACGQSLYIPAVDTVAAGHNVDELAVGRKLYIKHCGSCHNLFLPQSFSKEKWSDEMVEMKKEANISDPDAILILNYVTGFKTGSE